MRAPRAWPGGRLDAQQRPTYFCPGAAIPVDLRQQVILPSIVTHTAAQSADIQSIDVVGHKGIHLTSLPGDAEFTVYLFSDTFPAFQTADGALGLPVDVLGKEHLIVSYPGSAGSQFVVVGTEAGTTVTITPTATIGGHAAGVPYVIALGAGDTYLGRVSGVLDDLTGTAVTGDKPIAVLGGNQCVFVPFTVVSACDLALEQYPSLDAWGEKFLTVPHPLRTTDLIRITAKEDGTVVTVNGAPTTPATLNAGEYAELSLGIPAFIQSTSGKPVLVAQFEKSAIVDFADWPAPSAFQFYRDPSMMIVYPFEQFLSEYTFSTPGGVSFDDLNFVSLAVPLDLIGSVLLDGSPITAPALLAPWIPIGTGTGFMAAQVQLLGAPAKHTISAARPFGVYVTGNGNVTTFSFPGGMAAAPIATVATVTVSVTGGVQQVGTLFCGVTATVLDSSSNPVVGVRVDLTTSVTGHQASGFTNASGQVSAPDFCYTGTTVGIETAKGTVGSISSPEVNNVEWTPITLTASFTAADKVYDGTTAATVAT